MFTVAIDMIGVLDQPSGNHRVCTVVHHRLELVAADVMFAQKRIVSFLGVFRTQAQITNIDHARLSTLGCEILRGVLSMESFDEILPPLILWLCQSQMQSFLQRTSYERNFLLFLERSVALRRLKSA